MQMHRANTKRDALLFSQFEFLKTRQEAAEMLFLHSTIWNRLTWLINPARFKRFVDMMQASLMQNARREMAEAAEKPRIEIARGPIPHA